MKKQKPAAPTAAELLAHVRQVNRNIELGVTPAELAEADSDFEDEGDGDKKDE